MMTPKPSPQLKCSRCKEPVLKEGNAFSPFCSDQCRLIDLGQWLDGGYSVPGSDFPSSPDSESPNREG